MFGKKLYDQLRVLVEDGDSSFYSKVLMFKGATFEIFNYRIASYTEFMRPGGLECRGHTFELTDGGPVLVSLPMQKFFNDSENPLVMEVDYSKTEYVFEKLDGSLISTVGSSKGMFLKSKTSFETEHAIMSTQILEKEETLKCIVDEFVLKGNTVNMEYTSNLHRIVLPYTRPWLQILNVRNNSTGEYLSHSELERIVPEEYLVKNHTEEIEDFEAFFEGFRDEKSIEGYVVRLKDGSMVKLKTDEYVALHHAKDSVTAPRRLMEVVLEEASDDLRQMFEDDEQALREIENMEQYVSHIVAHLTKPVDAFWDANQHLERKDFAIKGQQELDRKQFTIAMGRYSGKEVDYKALVKKNHQEFLHGYETTLTTNEDEN